eukprot:366123-Chlamydomonas_euryale.AAC.2
MRAAWWPCGRYCLSTPLGGWLTCCTQNTSDVGSKLATGLPPSCPHQHVFWDWSLVPYEMYLESPVQTDMYLECYVWTAFMRCGCFTAVNPQ